MRAEDRSKSGFHTGSGLEGISRAEKVSSADWPTCLSEGKTEDVQAVIDMFSNPTAGHRNRQWKALIVGPIQSRGFLCHEIQKSRWRRS